MFDSVVYPGHTSSNTALQVLGLAIALSTFDRERATVEAAFSAADDLAQAGMAAMPAPLPLSLSMPTPSCEAFV